MKYNSWGKWGVARHGKRCTVAGIGISEPQVSMLALKTKTLVGWKMLVTVLEFKIV
jgi:hypothetical protein